MTTCTTPRTRRKGAWRLGCSLLLALGALTAPQAAWASRAPTGTEARRITATVHESALTIHVPDSAYSVASIRVATVGPWARARLVPGPGRVIQPALVVLSRQGAGWRLRDVGTVDVGCGIVPPTSRSDLALRCATVGPSFVSCVPPVPNFHQLHAYQVSCITARQVAMAVFSSATSSPPAGWSCTHHAIVQPGGIHSVYWSCTHAGSWRVTWIDHTE